MFSVIRFRSTLNFNPRIFCVGKNFSLKSRAASHDVGVAAHLAEGVKNSPALRREALIYEKLRIHIVIIKPS